MTSTQGTPVNSRTGLVPVKPRNVVTEPRQSFRSLSLRIVEERGSLTVLSVAAWGHDPFHKLFLGQQGRLMERLTL
jgi:hypothetical protein